MTERMYPWNNDGHLSEARATVEGYRAWKRAGASCGSFHNAYRFDRRFPLLPERPLAAVVQQGIRNRVSESAWQVIRTAMHHEWHGYCAVCNAPLEPPESPDPWYVVPHYHFDEATAVATLRRLVPLCQACFFARYLPRHRSDGRIPRQIIHTLQARNRCDLATVRSLIAEADAIFVRRSGIRWQVELGTWPGLAGAIN